MYKYSFHWRKRNPSQKKHDLKLQGWKKTPELGGTVCFKKLSPIIPDTGMSEQLS